jgi:hypothetical protein
MPSVSKGSFDLAARRVQINPPFGIDPSDAETVQHGLYPGHIDFSRERKALPVTATPAARSSLVPVPRNAA